MTQGRALPAVTYSINDGTHAGRTIDSPLRLTGARDWTEVTLFGSPPPRATCARIELRLFGPGTVWIDDLVVERAFGA